MHPPLEDDAFGVQYEVKENKNQNSLGASPLLKGDDAWL